MAQRKRRVSHADKKKQQQESWEQDRQDRLNLRRWQCRVLLFWRFCGQAGCLRIGGCAKDPEACFERFWPHVPEEVKVSMRGYMKARGEGMSVAEATRAAGDDLARYRDNEAREAEVSAAAARVETPKPAPPMPRIRVL